jgi:hypothetical protein
VQAHAGRRESLFDVPGFPAACRLAASMSPSLPGCWSVGSKIGIGFWVPWFLHGECRQNAARRGFEQQAIPRIRVFLSSSAPSPRSHCSPSPMGRSSMATYCVHSTRVAGGEPQGHESDGFTASVAHPCTDCVSERRGPQYQQSVHRGADAHRATRSPPALFPDSGMGTRGTGMVCSMEHAQS